LVGIVRLLQSKCGILKNSSRLAHPRKFQKKNPPGAIGAAPGESSDPPAEATFWARPAHEGLPADGAELGGAARGCGEGPWARARPPPEVPRPALSAGVRRLKTRRAGLMWVKDPEGGLARAHRLGGAPGRPSLELAGTGPVFDAPRYLTGASGRPP
jgi:hypothetical protein